MTASAPARDLRVDELRLALAGREAPFAVVDLDAWDANAQDLLRRAGRLPVRPDSCHLRVSGGLGLR